MFLAEQLNYGALLFRAFSRRLLRNLSALTVRNVLTRLTKRLYNITIK